MSELVQRLGLWVGAALWHLWEVEGAYREDCIYLRRQSRVEERSVEMEELRIVKS